MPPPSPTKDSPLPKAWLATLPPAYERDNWFTGVLAHLTPGTSGKKISGNTRSRVRYLSRDENGVIWNTAASGARRVAIPAGPTRDNLLLAIHDHLAHPSAQQLQDTISQRYFIPELAAICRDLTDNCVSCYTSRHMTAAYGFNGRHDSPQHPFHTISIDVATGLVETEDGRYNAVLVIQDDLTKMVVYTPTSTTAKASDFIEILQREVFRNFGVPSILKSDQQASFMSSDFQRYLAENGIKHAISTVDHHQHTVERAIAVLRIQIRANTDREGRGWLKELWRCQQATNRALAQTGDQRSFFERLLGYQPPLPYLQNPTLGRVPTELQAKRAEGWIRSGFYTLIDDYLAARDEISQAHDKGRVPSKIETGSWVAVPTTLAKTPTALYADNIADKSRPIFIGPFRVVRALEGDNMLVNLGRGNDIKNLTKFHVSVLKKLPDSAGNIPPHPDQPQNLWWADGRPKARVIVGSRKARRKTLYLAIYWGQHEAHGTWIPLSDLHATERHLVDEYDDRVRQDLPSLSTPRPVFDTRVSPDTPQ
jgi:hypothetical protein